MTRIDVIEKKARKIKLLVSDVDGVMTDGRIIYDSFGNELKCFNVQDGLGFLLLNKAGIKTAIITAKKSKLLMRRAKEIGVDEICQNVSDKLKVYKMILKKFDVSDEEVCYIGDDIIDIPILKRVGLPVAVANGVDEVRMIASYITKRDGGKGAVRETIDLILKAQNNWEKITGEYLD